MIRFLVYWRWGIACLAIASVGFVGCTNEEAAGRALQAAGYTHIELTGYRLWMCSDSDSTCTGFSATGPTGVRVTGAVGCGLFTKGCTVRTD